MAYQPTDTLTHSKLLAFTCPSRYHKLHVLGLKDDSDPARRGSTVHTANELYLAALVEAGEPSDFDLAQQCLQDAIVAETCPAHLVPDVEYLWQNHVERFELDLNAYLEAETRRSVGEFSFKPDWAYVYADRLEIHDLKTHYQALTEDGARRDLQARMYAFLASKVWQGFDCYRFVWHFIRLNQTVVTDFRPSDLDAIGRQLAAHAEAIEKAKATDDWPAAPGQQCQYCTFVCPAVDAAERMPARILTPEDAAKIAENLVVLNASIAQQKRVLEQYTALHGPVAAAGYEYAHRPYERKQYPAAAFIDTLRSHGELKLKLTFGASALRTYLTTKKWAFMKDDFEALAEVKTGTRFSAKKIDIEGDEPEDDATE